MGETMSNPNNDASLFKLICTALREMYFQAFGDGSASRGGDIVLPAVMTKWMLLTSMSNPSILYLRNMSTTDEFQFSWNDKNDIGGRVAKSTPMLFDKVIGDVFVKNISANPVTLNYYTIPVKLSE